MKTKIIIMAVSMMAFAACCGDKTTKVPALDLANLDTTVAPGVNFYQYATGGWQKNNPLKPEYARFGSFNVIDENNKVRLNDLFKSLAELKAAPGSNEQKIADLYKQGLDSVRLNAEGASPLKPYLDEIDKINDLDAYSAACARQLLTGSAGVWSVYPEADLMNSNMTVLYFGEAGLELGNRDYYLKDENKEIREGYLAYLKKVLALAGVENADQVAQDAYDIQMEIAVPYLSMVQQRDIQALYNPMTPEEIYAKYPNLHLKSFFEAVDIPKQEKIIVETPAFLEAVDKMFATIDIAKLRNLLKAQLVSDATDRLSDDFYEASFEFFSKQMAGIQEQKPRWKRAMRVPNAYLGEAVGKMYVEKFFPEKDKQHMLEIVKNIQKALGEHIASLEWMSDETKAKAQDKLANYIIKIGYPDKWKDYSTLEIDPAKSYYENCRTASLWHSLDELSKVGKPVDKTEWGMTPQTVNAYYNPTTNEICFPAGILQPPFFNPDADDAVNYGGIGVVISHEMTHGFDDQGRLFDKDGNMNDWWTPEDAEKFKAKAQKLVEQFNEVEIVPGLMANGEATLGENIADHGGLRIAFTAMQNSFGGKHPEPIDGFTAEQRFYLSYGLIWAQNITDQEKQRLTLGDVHSLGENRVNVSIRNLDTFFEAFGIKEGDPMFRPVEDRVTIW